ncbi:O-succinylbenzoate synthase [Mycobacterium sp. TNTM28]|uniref:O-succinylbenzoate synthase n=1 Tax=[Mycobacterium] fortunisiensis TaxID=2600579 RepID=A0ABS6KNS4_9MYCO|nr:o-succinylbenzoate synthase [[Mycobacterium] fortunisiensis]MBU9765170.1 O-succinylbenzoate synthase [[Mycobacterium] fortunisiensis]
MQTLIDFDRAPVFAIPTVHPVGGRTVREGMLIEGPQGWGEFSPPPTGDALLRWLTAATEPGTVGWPDPVRGRVPVAVTVPEVDAALAREIAVGSGCGTACVAVGAGPLADDVERVAAVRDGLGPGAAVRCDAKGRWDVDSAVAAVAALESAAGGLEFVAQPCATLDELAQVRRRVDVPIAAGESIRNAEEPMGLRLSGVVDLAVLATGPLGGARRALRVAEACGVPCVVGSTLETSIGLTAGLALAGALPELPYAAELGTRGLLAGDLVADSRSLVAVDGYLPVAPMPPAPQPGQLERFAVTDPDRVRWWRARLQAAIRGSDVR